MLGQKAVFVVFVGVVAVFLSYLLTPLAVFCRIFVVFVWGCTYPPCRFLSQLSQLSHKKMRHLHHRDAHTPILTTFFSARQRGTAERVIFTYLKLYIYKYKYLYIYNFSERKVNCQSVHILMRQLRQLRQKYRLHCLYVREKKCNFAGKTVTL